MCVFQVRGGFLWSQFRWLLGILPPPPPPPRTPPPPHPLPSARRPLLLIHIFLQHHCVSRRAIRLPGPSRRVALLWSQFSDRCLPTPPSHPPPLLPAIDTLQCKLQALVYDVLWRKVAESDGGSVSSVLHVSGGESLVFPGSRRLVVLWSQFSDR